MGRGGREGFKERGDARVVVWVNENFIGVIKKNYWRKNKKFPKILTRLPPRVKINKQQPQMGNIYNV